MITIPQILTHPHIPKPLHGISPRTIMGEEAWNIARQEIYKKYDYHCAACGVAKAQAKGHQWLEAHEFWNINYRTGICIVNSIEPLCHYCHNFIHSGRLGMIMKKEKTMDEVIDILEHGFRILASVNLKCFPFTLHFAYGMGAETFGVKAYELPDGDVAWDKWKLVWNGKEYFSKFKSYEEWKQYYSSGGK